MVASPTELASPKLTFEPQPNGNAADLVLDYLLSHKKRFVQEFLRQRNLYFSGTKQHLRQRLEQYLDEGQFNLNHLLQLLDQIEGWGNQHIYLYDAPSRLLARWLEQRSAHSHVDSLGLLPQLNRQYTLLLPQKRTLASINWTPRRLRLLWVEKRQWEQRLPDSDLRENGTVWRAYQVHFTRGIIAFDWDLVSGQAMLQIQRLPSGTDYNSIRHQLETELEPIVRIGQFERVRVSRAIAALDHSSEVRRRQLLYQTRRGSRASFTSAHRRSDTFADPQIEQAGEAFEQDSAGLLGNFYWHPVEGTLANEIHTKLYTLDQRVGIFGEHDERDIRYVLSRIRHHCR